MLFIDVSHFLFLGYSAIFENYSHLNGYCVSYSWCDTPWNRSLFYVSAIHLLTNIELLNVQVQCFLHFHRWSSNGMGYHISRTCRRMNLCGFLFSNEKCSIDLFLTFLFLARFISIFVTASFNDCCFIIFTNYCFIRIFIVIVIKSIYVNKGFLSAHVAVWRLCKSFKIKYYYYSLPLQLLYEYFLIDFQKLFFHRFFQDRPKKYEKWPIWIRFFACDLKYGPPTLSNFWLLPFDFVCSAIN